MKLGITGIHGSGKTVLSEIFERNGFIRFKNPYTFTSKEAKEIAFSNKIDQIKKAFIFLEDRVRCFLEMNTIDKVVTDRWWLDVCLNVESELLPIFTDFYCTPIFMKDFSGVYLDIEPKIAAERKENYSYEALLKEKMNFEKTISILKKKGYTRNFKFLIIKADDKTPRQLYDEIISKI